MMVPKAGFEIKIMITIIDFGMGNLSSIANMIKKLGGSCVITADLEKLKEAKKIILPGVGSFDKAISNTTELGIFQLIKEKANVKKIIHSCAVVSLALSAN